MNESSMVCLCVCPCLSTSLSVWEGRGGGPYPSVLSVSLFSPLPLPGVDLCLFCRIGESSAGLRRVLHTDLFSCLFVCSLVLHQTLFEILLLQGFFFLLTWKYVYIVGIVKMDPWRYTFILGYGISPSLKAGSEKSKEPVELCAGYCFPSSVDMLNCSSKCRRINDSRTVYFLLLTFEPILNWIHFWFLLSNKNIQVRPSFPNLTHNWCGSPCVDLFLSCFFLCVCMCLCVSVFVHLFRKLTYS